MSNYNSYIDAMHGFIAPSTTQDQRNLSQDFLTNQISNNSEFFIFLGEILMNSDFQSKELSIFALTLLHNWIKSWWDKLSFTRQSDVRDMCIKILLSPQTQRQNNPNYFNKFASIISNIAERLFPQYWTSFLDDILNQLSNGHIAVKEVAMKILQNIYVDCTDPDFSSHLSATRRQEILTGFKMYQNQLIQLVFQFLINNFALYKSTIQNPTIQAHDFSDLAVLKRLVILSFQVLQSMATIIHIDDMIEKDFEFISLLRGLLEIEDFQLDCACLLEKLFQRKIEDERKLFFIVEVLSTNRNLAVSKDLGDLLAFIKAYTNALVNILAHNMKELLTSSSMVDRDMKVQILFQELLTCLSSPSYRTAGDVLPLVHKIFRAEDIDKVGYSPALARAILDVYFQKSLKPLFLDDPLLDEEEWFTLEFDEREEWNDFHGTLMSQYRLFSTTLTSKFPLVMSSFVLEKTELIVKTDEKSFLIEKMAYLLKFNISSAFDAFSLRLEEENPSSDSLVVRAAIEQSIQAIDLIINWHPTVPAILREKIKLLGSCSVLLKFTPERVLQVLSFLFECLQFASDASGSSELRCLSDAAETIVIIIKTCASAICENSAIVEQLLLSVEKTMKSVSSVNIQTSMRESLVILSKYTSSAQLRVQILTMACEDLVLALEEVCREVYLSPEKFIELLQKVEVSGFTSKIDMTKEFVSSFTSIARCLDTKELDSRLFMNGIITTVEDVAVLFPLFHWWIRVLSVIYTLLKTLHSLQDKAVVQQIMLHPAGEHILNLIHGIAISDINRTLGKKISAASVAMGTQEELRQLLSVVYKSIGLAAKQRVLYFWSDNIAFCIEMSRSLQSLDLQLSTKLLKHSFISISVNVVPSVLGDYAQVIFSVIQAAIGVIEASWANLSSVDISTNSYPQLALEEVALIKENITREFSRSFCEYLNSLFANSGVLVAAPVVHQIGNDTSHQGNLTGQSHEEQSDVSEDLKATRRQALLDLLFDIRVEALTQAILNSILSLLRVPDTATIKQALLVTSSILSRAQVDQRLLSFICRDSFKEVFYLLLKADQWTIGLEWDLAEFLCDVFRGFVLPIEDLKKPDALDQEILAAVRCTLPVEVLAASGVVAIAEIEVLLIKLAKTSNKKKQRGFMKDFIADLLKSIHGQDSITQRGSGLVKAQPKVTDLKDKLVVLKPTKSAEKAETFDTDISGLFGP